MLRSYISETYSHKRKSVLKNTISWTLLPKINNFLAPPKMIFGYNLHSCETFLNEENENVNKSAKNLKLKNLYLQQKKNRIGSPSKVYMFYFSSKN